MHPRHMMLAVFVMIIWGFNFVFVQLGLDEFPPLALCAVRFFLASVPIIFFIKPPKVPWLLIILYSLMAFALHFSFLFVGMKAGVAPGLTSLLAQTQVFFSFILAALFLGERLTQWQIMGASLALVGLVVVAEHLNGVDLTGTGFVWIILGSITWGAGNLCIKKMKGPQGFSLIVWSSFLSFPLLLASSYVLEGPSAVIQSLQHISWRGLSGLLYVAYASTWMGYGLWAWLMSKYSVGTMVPFALLVPVVGMFASSLVLGEGLPAWKLMAAFFIMLGLVVHLFGYRLPKLWVNRSKLLRY
ncbi:MAG: EamA family transporter [Legionellaceae bacterium]|nr:EamA family transporter [Legionellaceae bacterium]